MNQVRYSISDASKKVEVEPHVLRYWEDELSLTIPRNAMGHRYYGEEELGKIQEIKHLKEQGFQLKAIKLVLPNIEKVEKLPDEMKHRLCEELNERVMQEERTGIVLHTQVNLDTKKQSQPDKKGQFQRLMTEMIKYAVEESNKDLCKQVSKEVSTNIVKELDYQFRMQEERQEAHFRKVDEMLRSKQKVRKRKKWL